MSFYPDRRQRYIPVIIVGKKSLGELPRPSHISKIALANAKSRTHSSTFICTLFGGVKV